MTRRFLSGALVLAVLAIAAVALAQPSAKPVATPCGPLRGDHAAAARLQVAGNRMRDSAGKPFMPYGISVVGGPQTFNWRQTQGAAAAQIIAAHRYWHANTVRLQVSEALLLKWPTRGHTYNVPFARAVDRLVCTIIRQGQIPVLNDTTLFTGREPGPTQRTIAFWRFMSKRYGNRFPVIFDLFNEPQVTRSRGRGLGAWLRPGRVWKIWRAGGTVAGIRYFGMQDLVNEIRVRQHVRNVIWAEEPYYVRAERARLGLLPRFRLKGADIVYAFHKPNMEENSRSYTELRAVAARGLPLVDSEWGQFAAIDRPWMCQPGAYRTAPPYLEFLRQASIGMLAWSLQPGALVKGVPHKDTVHDGGDVHFTKNPGNLAKPSEMKPSYGCTRAAQGQGSGRLVMDYFARYGAKAPARLFPRLG